MHWDVLRLSTATYICLAPTSMADTQYDTIRINKSEMPFVFQDKLGVYNPARVAGVYWHT
jgi:hypothetical protein